VINALPDVKVQNIALGGTKSTYVDWLITTTRKYKIILPGVYELEGKWEL
jgi:hypothetical protein